MKRNYKKADNRSQGQKVKNTVIASLSFMIFLFGLGGIQRWDNVFLAFISSLIGLAGLYYSAYSAGWLYDFIYEEDEE